MRLPPWITPGSPVRAAALAGVVLLSILVAVVVGAAGILGFSPDDDSDTWRTEATVVTGAGCDRPDASETVNFSKDGQDRTARLDACGHRDGETLEVAVPPDETTVHVAQAAAGARNQSRPVGLLLLVAAGVTGAAGTLLYRPLPLLR